MKNFSNTYIFLFSSGMVILVAAILAFVSESLKPLQERNVEIEKKQDILRSVGRAEKAGEVQDKNSYIEEEYSKYIQKSLVTNSLGEILEGRDAFAIMNNLKLELEKPVDKRELPVFLYTGDDNKTRYVIPVRGKGLWGPIWGCISLNDDFNTIYGAVFDHKGETPGLGAEIREKWFQDEFRTKKIFDESGKFISVEVVKGGTPDDNPHGVDAISGGTITSKGLEAMISDCLRPYEKFFAVNRK
jgi:Na+-transporting NADH:ubiquinone oxidoreductase subunit C